MSLWFDILLAVIKSRRFLISSILFCSVVLTGTIGFVLLGKAGTHWVDALYMTVITITTIGYGEVIEFTNVHAGRFFTMAIAILGIAVMGYVFTTTTTFILEFRRNPYYRRRRMEQQINTLRGHYIVCGGGRIGNYVVDELLKTQRQFVLIDPEPESIEYHRERTGHQIAIVADASDDDVLRGAGIEHAAGVFALTGDDARNLVISLSVKQVNPKARVVARVHDRRNIEKTRRAGADEIVSPDFTGGMRIASAMIRPQTVQLLDRMLMHDENLRVEDVNIPDSFIACKLSELNWPMRQYALLVAIKRAEEWIFNPDLSFEINARDVLVVMIAPQGREALDQSLKSHC